MYPTPAEIDLVIRSGESPSTILRGLYLLFKSKNSKYSISFLCRELGIPSKGNLSFMMQGTRKIPRKYWPAVCTVFRLNDEQSLLLENKFREYFLSTQLYRMRRPVDSYCQQPSPT